MALHGKKTQTNQTIKIHKSCIEGRKYMFLHITGPSDHTNGATGASASNTSLKNVSDSWRNNFTDST